jgi:hypothetical protein
MKTLTQQQQDEIENLDYYTLPEDEGQPHCAAQAIWSTDPSNPGQFAVLRRWDWDDDNGGRRIPTLGREGWPRHSVVWMSVSNTRHEYEVYEWQGEDEDPIFESLTLGPLIAKFIVPTK